MRTRIQIVKHEGTTIFLFPDLKFAAEPRGECPTCGMNPCGLSAAAPDNNSSAPYYDYLANEPRNSREIPVQ